MVRIDLFHPPKPSIYGTATAADIVQVCLAALAFNLTLAGIGALAWYLSKL